MNPTLDPKTSALLVMDFQTRVVEMLGAGADLLLARTASLVHVARKAGMKVIYIVAGFRDGYPEVSPRNKAFGPVRESGRFVEGSAGTEVHADLTPKPGDIVVTKHRVSAFTGTDLDMILRANGIDALVLSGIATYGVVLSTLCHAADADYRIVVVEDCCADFDGEVHRVLTEKVFPTHATVTKSNEVLAALAR
jgi:nicotinamidase-related amidase